MFDPAAARRVRLLGLDVDGVLTDNAVFIGEVGGERVEFKRFDIQDGLGLVLMRFAGVPVVLVSGRPSAATALRARELRIADVVQVPGPRKVPALQAILDRDGIGWDEVAFVGDDLADLPVLRRVGLPIAVANAVPDVRALAAVTTGARGGHGAVREVVEGLLRARGEWDAVLARYLAETPAGVG
jgi:3-deoxy-D-manno-octulosonate 8-phosphate phosphatase (KDO 8-P phosphatase)